MVDIKHLQRILSADSSVMKAIRAQERYLAKIGNVSRIALELERSSRSAKLALEAFESSRTKECIAKVIAYQNDLDMEMSAVQKAAKLMECKADALNLLTANKLGAGAVCTALRKVQILSASSLAASRAVSSSLTLYEELGFSEAYNVRLLQPALYESKLTACMSKRFVQADSAYAEACTSALKVSSLGVAGSCVELAALASRAVVDDGIAPSRLYNLVPAVMRDQLLLPDTGLSRQLPAKAHWVLHLIVQCNEAALLNGGTEIFKPTTKMMCAFADGPMIVATNRTMLGEFLDCLYFALYEGAGADKLRFLASHGGVLDSAECRAIWAMKTLRNKWLRHDPDHGSESTVTASWAELRKELEWLGLCGIPSCRSDFIKLQLALLEHTEALLQILVKRLNERGQSMGEAQ